MTGMNLVTLADGDSGKQSPSDSSSSLPSAPQEESHPDVCNRYGELPAARSHYPRNRPSCNPRVLGLSLKHPPHRESLFRYQEHSEVEERLCRSVVYLSSSEYIMRSCYKQSSPKQHWFKSLSTIFL